MHIAICDDNGADRKQLERLLKRESDKRAASTGVLYIDSYGNSKALLANPLLYDVFYIDMCHTPGEEVSQIIGALEEKGVHAPIVLCCSLINYREQSFPEHVFFLDKAIKAGELSESLDLALAIRSALPEKIEIRDEEETVYVTDHQILYAIARGNVIEITLEDGRVLRTRTSIPNLFSQWESHECFLNPTSKTILNGTHISSIGLLHAHMSDGTKFSLPKYYRSYAQALMESHGNSE